MVMHRPERTSNSQPWSGHVTMSPSTKPSERLPSWCGHRLPNAKISSPRRKSKTSSPSTLTSEIWPVGNAERSSTLTRAMNLSALAAVGLVQHLDDVLDLDGRARRAKPLDDLDDAAGIGGDDGLGAGLPNMRDLPPLQPLRHLRLHEVVRPGGSAAPIGLRQLDELKSRHLGKQGAWFLPNLLAMRDVTRIVVRHDARHRAERAAERLHRQELGDVAYASGEALGTVAPLRIVGQQRAVALHVRAASRRVDDDVLDAGRLERLDRALCQIQRQRVLAAVRVKRSAARLVSRRHDLRAVQGQHARRGVVLRTESDLLDASGQQPDFRALGANRRRDLRHRRSLSRRRQLGQERLPRSEWTWQQLEQSRGARE